MKEQTGKFKIIYIILAIIILIGIIIGATKGFNMELNYSLRQQFVISSDEKINKQEVEEIANEILTNRKVKIQKVDRFEKAVQIISSSISTDEKNAIVNKFNEKYSKEISAENIEIADVSNTRIRDILKPYILPAIISFSACLLYLIIVYNKIGLKRVLLTGICVPIISEVLFYSIIAITRLPFGRITNAIAIGIYVLSIFALTTSFQNEKDKIKEMNKKENDK